MSTLLLSENACYSIQQIGIGLLVILCIITFYVKKTLPNRNREILWAYYTTVCILINSFECYQIISIDICIFNTHTFQLHFGEVVVYIACSRDFCNLLWNNACEPQHYDYSNYHNGNYPFLLFHKSLSEISIGMYN